MLPSVHYLRLHVDHRVAAEDARLQRLQDALFHPRDVAAGDGAAHGAVLETELLTSRPGLDLERDPGVLAVSAGLLLVLIVGGGRPGDRLAVRDAGQFGLHLDLVAVADPAQDHSQVQLPDRRDHGLPGLAVVSDAEGRIGIRGPADDLGELVLVLLGCRPQGERVHRVREVRRHVGDRCLRSVQRVGGGDIVQLVQHADVPGRQLLHILQLLALAGAQLVQPNLGARTCADQICIGAQAAGDDLYVRQPPGVLVDAGLQHQRGRRAGRVDAVIGGQAGAVGLHRRAGRRRHRAHDRVEQGSDARVVQGRSCQHREHLAGSDG